jgi:uncharacterized protein YjbI with pentapeptide repeats
VELCQCGFRGANFTKAILRGAAVDFSSFNGANFTNADLRDIEGFYNIRQAVFSNTIMDDGSVWYDSIGCQIPNNIAVRIFFIILRT